MVLVVKLLFGLLYVVEGVSLVKWLKLESESLKKDFCVKSKVAIKQSLICASRRVFERKT